jgi:hypothetical protein
MAIILSPAEANQVRGPSDEAATLHLVARLDG